MQVLGLDIGTTNISAVILDGSQVLAERTVKNDATLTGGQVWEHTQAPARISELCAELLRNLLREYPAVSRIGLTGQQHGIVYLDVDGQAVSPLYTWQDGRGDLPFDGSSSYASHLSGVSGYSLASGYGCVTHFYNLRNGLVPQKAVTFCTIHDYIALHLCGAKRPLLDASNAASFGLFDIKSGRFDTDAAHRAGIDPAIFPQLAPCPHIGETPEGRVVFSAIGDNQASFLGATAGQRGVMLVNFGTGSQFSVHVPSLSFCCGLETRPSPMGGFLLVGSGLCGGKAYALLEQFFSSTIHLLTGQTPSDCYAAMAQVLDSYPEPKQLPCVSPLFEGTREQPSLRASITGLDSSNFTPVHLLYGMLHGMVNELYSMYSDWQRTGESSGRLLYGAGNGLRRNPALCRIVETTFGQPLHLSPNREDAACGAAIFAESI